MEEKLAQRERRHNTLMENAGDAVVILSGDGKSLYASSSVYNVIGYTVLEFLQLDLISLSHPDDSMYMQKILHQALTSPGMPIRGHTYRMLHKDGSWHWYEAIITNMLHDPEVGGIVDNFRDVTDRVKAEERNNNANKLYAFISQINQTIVHAEDKQQVFTEACRIAIEYGKFQMAWIGQINADDKNISLVASSGISTEDKLKFINATYVHDGPLGQVLQSGKSFVCNNIEKELTLPEWKIYAASRGLHSFMMLPIKKAGIVIGILSLYACQKHLFDTQEIKLLEEVAGDISFSIDVFEKEALRQAAENKLRHSELRLTEAQAIAHMGSWEIDFSTGISLWSEEACRIYGLPSSENLQSYETWLSFLHPEDLDFVLKATKDAEATLSSSAFYHRIIRKDGSIRHLYSKTEFDFIDGKPVGLHGVAHDVTDIREAEKARAQSDANLLLIMDLIPQAIFVKNFEGKYLFVNKSFANLYGLTPEELIEKSNREEITVASEKNIFLKQDQKVITSGITQVIPEVTFTKPNGESRFFYTIKVPYTLSGKNEKGVLGIALDITEQKIVSAEREKLMADLVQRNKDLEQFSYIISHNLRAPVANILGITDIIQTMALNQEDEKVLMQGLETSVKKLDEVITDLNYILQLNHNESKEKELVLFSEVLDDIKLSINNEITSADARIVSDFSVVEQMHTLKGYIYSIFFNLILNSIKYRRADIKPIIHISSQRINNKIQIIFSDNGLGIDLNKYRNDVFSVYKRFHPNIEGKGIGLYMVKTHVESLNGRITVESVVNQGTEFKITFD